MESGAAGAPAGPSRPSGSSRYQQNQRKYGIPLPILLPNDVPGKPYGKTSTSTPFGSVLSAYLPSILSTRKIDVPQCIGVYDPVTRSVWITDRRDIDILFQRGFFGKGTLSRSEATWRDRRIDQVKGGESALAEQIRAKRRQERKQFKIDRAAAMMQAAKTAEAVLTGGLTPTPTSQAPSAMQGGELDIDLTEENRDMLASPAPSEQPSVMDVSNLTPQTFLVRPTRPDANRNRGRKAFKRRPPKPVIKPAEDDAAISNDQNVSGQAVQKPVSERSQNTGAQAATGGEGLTTQTAGLAREGDDEGSSGSEEDPFGEELLEEMEHLQLGLEEAWFLAAALGVLRVYDQSTQSYPPIAAVLELFLTPPSQTILTISRPTRPSLYLDDPFIISYVAYHHFRSLGWVVKPGIKFCCDWLLYRRGPVFSHSAFSCVTIPVYSDPEDRARSPYGAEDWYEERQSWKWINTVMRVNALVQKTVILVYITVPPMSSIPARYKQSGGGIDPLKLGMRDMLERFMTREVSLSSQTARLSQVSEYEAASRRRNASSHLCSV